MSTNTYSEEFKKNVVQKLLLPNSGGLSVMARKYDVHPSTLFCWRKKYANFTFMKKSKNINDWTSEQKLDAVIKTASMTEQELGEFLRSSGLHSSDLIAFKNDFLSVSKSKGRPKLAPEVVELRKEVKDLTKNLRRKDAALSEYAARVVLLKKSHEIWGTKEDDE